MKEPNSPDPARGSCGTRLWRGVRGAGEVERGVGKEQHAGESEEDPPRPPPRATQTHET